MIYDLGLMGFVGFLVKHYNFSMRKDAIHDPIKQALINDDWTIIREHHRLSYKEVRLGVDISAKKTIIAEQDERKILIEVKSFSGRSFIQQLQAAIGQYRVYRDVIIFNQLDFELYLGISEDVYTLFFTRPGTQDLINANQIKLLVVDIENEKVIQWIK